MTLEEFAAEVSTGTLETTTFPNEPHSNTSKRKVGDVKIDKHGALVFLFFDTGGVPEKYRKRKRSPRYTLYTREVTKKGKVYQFAVGNSDLFEISFRAS